MYDKNALGPALDQTNTDHTMARRPGAGMGCRVADPYSYSLQRFKPRSAVTHATAPSMLPLMPCDAA
eukprot:351575-Chlamydomonas_euryale.AAC.4